MSPSLLDRARELQPELVSLRHALHSEPEVGLKLPRTQERVLQALGGLDLEISTGTALSSVTAIRRGSRPGPTVLLRADMDALPLTENTDRPYASKFPDAMHACGHDLHTSMLVGAAQVLAGQELAGDVIFMFQPGEEGHGGAKLMIEEGVLEATGQPPAAAYALHVIGSMIPAGLFMSKAGTVLAACDTLRVTVRGAGGHSGTPHLAKDPIPVACEMVTALQVLATRQFDAFDPVIITVGSFNAGSADNAIAQQARFGATLRSFSRGLSPQLQERAVRLVREIASAHGLEAEIEYVPEFPVTVNEPAEVGYVSNLIREVFGPGRYVEAPRPMPASEDFSYVLEKVPGAFIAVGACPADRNPLTAAGNHSPEALFADEVLADGAALYAELAVRRLQRG
jgi:hippurate hydrolase